MTDAKEYGKALFTLAKESGTVEELARDVSLAADVFKANPDYARLLDTPAVTKAERVALVDESFSSLHEYLVNLIKIMAEAHLSHAFCSAADEYLALYDGYCGIVRVEAVSAVAMTREQTENLEKKLSEMLGGKAIVSNTVDPSILGGMKIRYGATQLDGSVKTRLDKLESALRSTVI